MMTLRPRPRGMPSGRSGHSGIPKRRKNSRKPGGTSLVAEAIGLRAAIDLDADRNHRRFDLLDDVGKADRRLQLVRLLASDFVQPQPDSRPIN